MMRCNRRIASQKIEELLAQTDEGEHGAVLIKNMERLAGTTQSAPAANTVIDSDEAANVASVLDAQSDWILVIGPADFRVLYRNSALQKTPLRAEVGEHCHAVRFGSGESSRDCLMKMLTPEPQYIEMTLADGKRFSSVAQEILWDGRKVCLLTGRLDGRSAKK